MFDDIEERAQAVAVPLFYGIVEAVAIGVYCVWAWKVGWTKAPPNEKLCTVVTKSYEINHEAEHEQPSDDEAAVVQSEISAGNATAFGDEAVVQAMESQTKRDQADGRGLLGKMRQLFKGDGSGSSPAASTGASAPERPVELKVDEATGAVDTQYSTPSKDNSRRRMTSDYTADTAKSSPSPQTNRRSGKY